MKQFMQNIKNRITRLRLQYSKYDDGLYLFFMKDTTGVKDNVVYITSAIPQNISLKKKNEKGEYCIMELMYLQEGITRQLNFSAEGDYVIYIPKANRITYLTLDDSTVTNPLCDFARMTSLTLLSIIDTNVYGNIDELKKLPFLNSLHISDDYIKGINSNTFKKWPHKLNMVDVV